MNVWNSDYVDVHGRRVDIMISEGEELFIPLEEVKKLGYHIFHKEEYDLLLDKKRFILKEFELFMIGAAEQYLIERNIHSLKQNDILKTIDMCEQYIESFRSSDQPSNVSRGLLGRQLLVNPAEIRRNIQSNLLQNNQQPLPAPHVTGFERLGNHSWNKKADNEVCDGNFRSNMSISSSSSHVQQQPKDFSRSTGNCSNGDYSTVHKKNFAYPKSNIRNSYSNNVSGRISSRQDNKERNNFNQQHKNNFRVSSDDNNSTRSHENFAPNARVASRREQDSKSSTDNEDCHGYVRLSDLNVKRIQLQKNFQEVKVVYVEKNKDKEKYWVQLVENENLIMELLEKINDIGSSAPLVASPKLNQMYITYRAEDELWYRVIVQKLSPFIKVHFVDYGNDGTVTELRQIPEDIAAIPAQAARITLTRQEGTTPEQLVEEEILSIKFMKQFQDTTILVAKETLQKNTQIQKPISFETTYMKQIKYSSMLVEKEEVKIIAYSDGRFYLRNKEHHKKLMEILNQIKDTPKVVEKEIDVGQVVLCKKDEQEQWCRAVVRKIDGELVNIQFVDFYTSNMISIKQLYSIPQTIATLPVALIESPQINGYNKKKLSTESEALLDDVITNKKKLIVSSTSAGFDLVLGEKLLSEILFPKDKELNVSKQKLASPPKQTQNEIETSSKVAKRISSPAPATAASQGSKKYEKMFFKDMPSLEVKMGLDDYLVTYYKSPTDFVITSTGEEETDMFCRCTDITVTDDEPYEPEETEMVLARFEGCWYRSVMYEILDNGKYQVFFVEYGNFSEVTKDDIRKIPDEFRTLPMLGLSCHIHVPETEVAKDRLKELIKQDNIYEMNILSYDAESMIYTLEIPKINDILKKEGLI